MGVFRILVFASFVLGCFPIKTDILGTKNLKDDPGSRYKTLFFSTKVDHFSFTNDDKYKMRYLMADQFWDQHGGPIFFYTGNEGDIEWFCNNTGIMWEWAPEFKALLIFAEHRYYGMSLPYGNNSFKNPKYVGYLTAEQALADYAELVLYIKQSIPGAVYSPVISFGGSYGGMLSAWFRMKYPHIVHGALAASAPIWQFEGLTSCSTYYEITSKVYTDTSQLCAANIHQSWKILDKYGATKVGREFLSSEFKLCDPLRDIELLKQWLSDAWTYMAMVNYPYPTSFLEPLPAWPIKVTCSHLSSLFNKDKDIIQALYRGVSVYHNYTGQVKCYNLTQDASADLGDVGWNFQSCMEMVMPLCSDGIHDIFPPSPWNLTKFAEDCQKNYNLTPRPDWIKTSFGGKNITSSSNIIFSNGLLDPWYGGGVLQSLSDSLIAIVIEQGAHHLDLRASNPADPACVKTARTKEKNIIHNWIKHFIM